MKIRFSIDEKSLYRGIVNNYEKGQSATVHTPLNQSKDPTKWRKDIYDFIANYPSMDVTNLPSVLVDKCIRKTVSQAGTKLVKFYCFSELLIDGKPFSPKASFAIYVKEEIDRLVKGKDGKAKQNVHFGRQKLHYPITLKYISDGFNIDNEKVLNTIMDTNGGFAYVVHHFEIDTLKNSLNFITTMIGLKDAVLLSDVFIRKKGRGQKLHVTAMNSSPRIQEYCETGEQILTHEENEKFYKTLEKIEEARRKNGLMGEEYVFNNIQRIIGKKVMNPVHTSKKYPSSPYDIEYELDGVKMYLEVKSTSGKRKEFYMSREERHFMEQYNENYSLVLVIKVGKKGQKDYIYTMKQIMLSTMMHRVILDMKFSVVGEGA